MKNCTLVLENCYFSVSTFVALIEVDETDRILSVCGMIILLQYSFIPEIRPVKENGDFKVFVYYLKFLLINLYKTKN